LTTNTKAAMHSLVQQIDTNIYTFPMFTESTCNFFLQELDYYTASNLPSPRPNSMNKYGLILNSIGLADSFSRLQADVLNKISAHFFPEEGLSLDTHHTFLVQYKPGEDLGLDMHTDDSDVTFNVCLGRDGFTGANLEFCGAFGTTSHRQQKATYKHIKGHCVVHLGRQRHGACNILSGERINLIIWNKSLPYRSLQKSQSLASLYAKELAEPAKICLSHTHDRDFDLYHGGGGGVNGGGETKKEIGQGHGHQSKRWCPPSGKEHDGSPLLLLPLGGRNATTRGTKQ
jgi:hypothetical protein